jgi:hypothetical protein
MISVSFNLGMTRDPLMRGAERRGNVKRMSSWLAHSYPMKYVDSAGKSLPPAAVKP